MCRTLITPWQPVLPKNVENPLEKKLGPQETGETLEADLVVLALGGKPNDALFYEAQRQGCRRRAVQYRRQLFRRPRPGGGARRLYSGPEGIRADAN